MSEVVSWRYLGSAGAQYASDHQADPGSKGYVFELEYFLPYVKRSHILLDFGCGNGGLLRVLATHVARADGLEVNARSADTARSLGFKVYSSLNELPGTPTYDVVVSNHVLEHVRDVPGTLQCVRQSMKPDSLLLLKLPIDDWRSGYQKKWTTYDRNNHLHTWTPRLIANVLHESGFNTESVRILTSAWHPRLFPLVKLKLHWLGFWLLAIVKKRRQLFVVGRVGAEARSKTDHAQQ